MPEIEIVDKQLRKQAIIKGVLLGFIILSLSIFSFYFITGIAPTMALIVAGPYFFSVIIPIAVTVMFCLNIRSKIGGYWSFKQSVTGIFIMFLISYAVLTVGRDLIFAKFIEHNMASKTEAVMLNVRTTSLKMSGASSKEIASQITELKKEFEGQRSPGILPVVQNYMINIIMLFVLAILFGAIFKKEQPSSVIEIIDIA